MPTRHCLKGWRADAIHLFDRNARQEDAARRLLPPYIPRRMAPEMARWGAAISKPDARWSTEVGLVMAGPSDLPAKGAH